MFGRFKKDNREESEKASERRKQLFKDLWLYFDIAQEAALHNKDLEIKRLKEEIEEIKKTKPFCICIGGYYYYQNCSMNGFNKTKCHLCNYNPP